MAIEYEDIDLGQVSGGGTGGECEVTKEEFDLAKLEAEGWVTEIVISDAYADAFSVSIDLPGEYDANNNPIIALKVNNELVEPIRDDSAWEGYATYCYDLRMDLPIGTSIKIYHNPNMVDEAEFYPMIYVFNDDAVGNPTISIYKCVKCIKSLLSDVEVRCYSLPERVKNISLTCLDITAHVPSNTHWVEISPALVKTDEVSEDGGFIHKYVDLEVHLDGLPEEWVIYGDTEAQPDLHVKGYVPYHLLEEAKARFPDSAEFIDALVPASEVGELGGSGKLYKHSLYIDYYDVDGVNSGSLGENGKITILISVVSTKSYLFGKDLTAELDEDKDKVTGKYNDDIVNHLGFGMSAIMYVTDGNGNTYQHTGVIVENTEEWIDIYADDGNVYSLSIIEGYKSYCYIHDEVVEM